MQSFFSKYLKNGLIYASIGLFAVGGLCVVSAQSVFAASDFTTVVLPYTDSNGHTYDSFVEGCDTGPSPCNASHVVFFNSATAVEYPSGVLLGTGDVIAGHTGYGDIAFFEPSGTDSYSTSNWDCSGNGNYSSCNQTEYNGYHGVQLSYSGVLESHFVSSRNWYAYGGSPLLYTTSYPPIGGIPVLDTSTHFISETPPNASTTATTTSVGADVYANNADFPNYGRVLITFTHDGTFSCENSGAVYDAVNTCAAQGSFAQPFTISFDQITNRLLSGEYDLATTTTFPGGGNWTAVYQIQQVSSPWYFFGLSNSYNTLVSTTTHFTIGQLSAMDIARAGVQAASAAFQASTSAGIGAILASTTASLANACNPFGSFSLGDCLTLTVWPGDSAVADDFLIIKETPPWGYVFRVIDILNATTSSTTLPAIDYTFATSSPMVAIGDIHFDPFGEIAQAGTLVNTFTSDRGDGATVWTILMPVVNIFVYMVLFFMIIHDLTGIHGSKDASRSKRGSARDS